MKRNKAREKELTRQFAIRYKLLPRLYDFYLVVRDAILQRLENEHAAVEQHTFYNWLRGASPMKEYIYYKAMDELEKWEQKWPEFKAEKEAKEQTV